MPVLLVMDVPYKNSGFCCLAYLDDDRSSAFAENEKEYLLSWNEWRVTAITEETLEYRGRPFKAFVVKLYDIFYSTSEKEKAIRENY